MLACSDRDGNTYDMGDQSEQTEIKIENLQRVQLEPGDVVLIQCQGMISPGHRQVLYRDLKAVFPGHSVIVLDRGDELSIIGADR